MGEMLKMRATVWYKILNERPRHRWDDNIKMNLLNLRSNFVCWVHLIQDKVNCGAFVNMVMNFCVTLITVNFFTSLANVSVSRRAHFVEVFACCIRISYC
jgi:hypothetical protein